MPAERWTDERIREAFIYDGGESEYHDPINGAQTQRQVAGKIFDNWLKERDDRQLGPITDEEVELAVVAWWDNGPLEWDRMRAAFEAVFNHRKEHKEEQ